MFKAKIIQDDKYFSTKKWLLNFGLIGSFLGGLSYFIFYIENPWMYAILLVLTLILFYIKYQFESKINHFLGKKSLAINKDFLTIDEGNSEMTIPMKELSNLSISKELMALEVQDNALSTVRPVSELSNIFKFRTHDKEYSFHLVIDSYYMVEQLKKLIQNWEMNGMVATRL